MKRVLLTVHKFFPDHKAGTEVLTFKVAQELQRRGCEVLVLTADPPDLDANRRNASGADTEVFQYEGVPVKVFREPLRLRGYGFSHEYNHPGMASEFARTLDEFHPDIVHIFHAQNFSAAIIEEARTRGLPVVCSTTDFWFVCPIVQLKLPNGSVCRGPSQGAKNCLSCYTPKLFPPVSEFKQALFDKFAVLRKGLAPFPAPVANAIIQGLFSAYKNKKRGEAVTATVQRPSFLREAANHTQAIMVPTRLMRDIFVENGIDSKLIHHVPFGIDTAPLLPYQKKSDNNGVLRVGFIGTLFEHKGVDLLIRAFLNLPAKAPAVLKIYGDPQQFPEYGSSLLKLARQSQAGMDKIQFLGTFPNEKLGPVLQDIDVLVVPSRWYENTPLVLQSALCTKTPLIATDLGGLSELIQHESNGLLFPLNDEATLSKHLLRLVEQPSYLAYLRENIKPERTISNMVDDIQSIYINAAGATVHDRIASLVG